MKICNIELNVIQYIGERRQVICLIKGFQLRQKANSIKLWQDQLYGIVCKVGQWTENYIGG